MSWRSIRHRQVHGWKDEFLLLAGGEYLIKVDGYTEGDEE
jgi:hypothetical protein